MRAARLLQQLGEVTQGVDISIDKQLPAGAGMGGGSSDAATTLLVLNRLWQLNWPRERLAAVALKIGADVPFFIGGHNAFVEGIGEVTKPVVLPERRFVVVKPPDSIETRVVFASPLLRRSQGFILSGFAEEGGQFTDAAFGRNDLQDAAEAASVQVGEAAAWLKQRFGNSRMTGSGSAVFANLDPVQMAKPELADLPPGWVGRTCRSLPRHPLVGWADDDSEVC